MEYLLEDINEKIGLSGRNVWMGLLFWPGIFVNEMNASDAERLANRRIEVLQSLYKEKKCRMRKKSVRN